MSRLTVSIKRVGSTAFDLPRYMTAGAAGMDLRAGIEQPLRISPGEIVRVSCGFAIAIPEGYEGQVRPRSGLAFEHGLTIPNAPGTIDADYRGEVAVLLINLGKRPVDVAPGDRIAQLVICPVACVDLVEVDELLPTARGSGGFGHTRSRSD
jgi:dUTP pyrophosphatase